MTRKIANPEKVRSKTAGIRTLLVFAVVLGLFLAKILLSPGAVWSTPTSNGTIDATHGGCGACHGNPPTDGTRSSVTGSFVGSHTKHAQLYNFQCSYCHQLVSAGSYSHRNGSINMASPIYSGSGAYSKLTSFPQATNPTMGTCSTVYCHSTVQGANGSGIPASYWTPTWGATGSMSCGSCHADMSLATSSTNTVTGSHVKHAGSVAGSYSMPCSNCHGSGYSVSSVNTSSHANNIINTAFTGTGLGSVYSGNGRTAGNGSYGNCTVSYCHSNASPIGGTSSYSTPTWGQGALACTACHRGPASISSMQSAGTPSPMSAGHFKHLATDLYGTNANFNCSACHNSTASSNSAISNYTNHVNGTRDWQFGTFNGINQGGGSYAGSGNACTSTYCHSDGKKTSAPFNAAAGTLNWSAGYNSDSCTSCHGGVVSNASVTLSSPHGRHMGSDNAPGTGTAYAFSCDECHAATVTSHTTNSILASTGYAKHVNGVKDLLFSSDVDTNASNYSSATGTYTGSPSGSCSNIYCHSQGTAKWTSPTSTSYTVAGVAPVTTPTWTTGTLACNACHGQSGQTGIDIGRPAYSNGYATGSKANSHYSSGNTHNSQTCDVCHYPTTHDGSTIYDRTKHVDLLYTINNNTNPITYASGVVSNGVPTGGTCSVSYCHGTSSVQWGTSLSNGCASCHGASNDGSMSFYSSSTTSGGHSIHYNTATVATSLTWTTNSFPNNYAFACGNCHPTGQHTKGPQTAYSAAFIGGSKMTSTQYSAGTSSIADARGFNYTNGTCSTNSCHNNGQLGGAPLSAVTWTTVRQNQCNVCHGNKNSAQGVLSGDHYNHVQGLDCSNCHAATASGYYTIGTFSTHANGTIDISFNATTAGLTGATYNGNPALSPTDYQKPITAPSYGSCTNIKCHSDGTGIYTGTITATPTPNWSTTTVSCTACHGSTTINGYTNYRAAAPQYTSNSPKPNAHSIHIDVSDTTVSGSTAANAGPQCNDCHLQSTATNTSINSSFSTHANGTYDLTGGTYPKWSDGSDSSAPVTLTYNYTGTPTPSTCSNVSCHPTGTTTLNNASTTLSWDDKATASCTDCHSVNLTANYTYHHAMTSENFTPNPASETDYPISVPSGTAGAGGTNYTSRTCMMCHVKHNIFSDRLNANANLTSPRTMTLRTSITVTPTSAASYTNSDYIPGGGICISCHTTGALLKDTTRQAQIAGVTKTLQVTDAQFSGSAHNFYVPKANKTVSTSYFNANCSKCHSGKNTEGTTTFSTSTSPSLGTHDAVQRRVLGSLGITAMNGNSTSVSNTTTLTDSTKNALWTANTWSGANVIITAGLSSGQVRQITGNTTAGVLNLASALNLDTTSVYAIDPEEENLCYRCHSRAANDPTPDTTPGGGPAKSNKGFDYYGIQAMSSMAEKIFSMFNTATYPFGHAVAGTRGIHKTAPNEGQAANDGTLSGTNRHTQCEDCHNTHAAQSVASGVTGTLSSYTYNSAGNDTLTVSGTPWATNAYVGWTVKIIGNTGAGKMSVIFSNTANTLSAKIGTSSTALDNTSKYVIYKMGTPDGNLTSNPQLGVWGVTPTTWPSQSPPNWNDASSTGCGGSATTQGSCSETDSFFAGQFPAISNYAWTRTESATIQGAICIKCHSMYAYGSTPPKTPSGQPNGTSSAGNNVVSGLTLTQGDKAQEFNPNNLGYHPIFARGMNQPVRANYGNTTLGSAVNTNWPYYSAGSIAVTNGAATLTSATLPSTALPGWFVYIGATAPVSGATSGASNNQTGGTTTPAYTGYLEITSITDATHFTVRAETTSGPTPTSPPTSPSTWTYNNAPNVTSTSSWFLTAGLGNNFVPPFGPWSTLQCTDCHTSNTTTDPMGPHGSAYKYVLIQSSTTLYPIFTYMSSQGATVAYTIDSVAPVDGDNFCINCHRKSVYGDYGVQGTLSTWSRQSHPIDASGTGRSLGKKPSWGPVCMNCHGGAFGGAIHGINLGKGNSGTAASYSGKRLLAGAHWTGVTRSTRSVAGTCYLKPSTSGDAVDNCGNSTASGSFNGAGTTANYQFDDLNP